MRVLSCALLLIRVAQVHSFAVSSCVFGCCASAGACCLVAMPLRRIKGRMEPCGDTETDKSLRLTKLCPWTAQAQLGILGAGPMPGMHGFPFMGGPAGAGMGSGGVEGGGPVSYTHLTLPTILLV